MTTEGKPAISKVYDALWVKSLDPEIRWLYIAREIFLSDQATRICEAKEEGRKEGRLEARNRGKAEGIEKVAKNLLSLGMEDDLIMKATGLDEYMIEKLKQSLLPTQ